MSKCRFWKLISALLSQCLPHQAYALGAITVYVLREDRFPSRSTLERIARAENITAGLDEANRWGQQVLSRKLRKLSKTEAR